MNFAGKTKGRLLPKTKNHMVDLGLRLTAGGESVPEVRVHVPMPGSKEEEEGDSVFEQLFKKLPKEFKPLGSRRAGSEAQLWKVRVWRYAVCFVYTCRRLIDLCLSDDCR